MKPLLAIAVCAIAAASLSACQNAQDTSATASPSKPAMAVSPASNVKAEITKMESEGWVQADLKKDITWFEQHWADEFTVTSGRTGKVTNKSEELAMAKDPANTTESEVVSDLKVIDLGNTAVAIGKDTAKGKDKGVAFTRVSNFTDVWVNRDGRWQCVASHGSIVTPEAKK